ncbi:putative oxidoreductase [Dioscorea sansibarensis]
MKTFKCFILLLLLPLFFSSSLAFPLCTDSRAPVNLKSPLTFCSYNGSSCCNSSDDTSIQNHFNSMNINDSACASLVKSILCSKCNPFSAELFIDQPKIQTVPVLCSPTNSEKDFCGLVWDTCSNTSIDNSPFAPSLQQSKTITGSSSKIIDFWQSKSDFCKGFGTSSSNDSVCFDGNTASFNTTPSSPNPKGLCIEKIGNGSYLNMVPHPDGSNRVFLSNQEGKIWLATVPDQESGATLELDESNPFLDLTDEVHYDIEFGLLGLAFHPKFTTNGRFFVSFNCDRSTSSSCSGTCACNSEVDCDPSKLPPDNGAKPCQYQSVIAEYSVNTSSTIPSMENNAIPNEVRRIFTMGLPFTSHHAGQILFGPEDGYLYFMMGDGGGDGDPYNFAQNKKSLLGKILRLDINNIPSSAEINKLGLWGSYSIPEDNPSVDDSELQPEIWALGFRNPWRCSFDSERPSYFFCADVGQDKYEEVDLISKGGNYGWRVYEGLDLYHPKSSPGGNTSANSINAIFPVMGYTHSSVNTAVGSASITGGYVYRSMVDPCMHGKYLYADLYTGGLWAGLESPESSGNYTSIEIPFNCGKNSPIPCDAIGGNSAPSLNLIFSFGEDNRKDVFLLASNGVYRVVRPSRCNYECSKEKNSSSAFEPVPSPPSSSAHQLKLMLFICFFFILVSSSFNFQF